jgi:hypothetical protein
VGTSPQVVLRFDPPGRDDRKHLTREPIRQREGDDMEGVGSIVTVLGRSVSGPMTF